MLQNIQWIRPISFEKPGTYRLKSRQPHESSRVFKDWYQQNLQISIPYGHQATKTELKQHGIRQNSFVGHVQKPSIYDAYQRIDD